MARRKHSGAAHDPSVDREIAKRNDEWSQRFPNDWLEASIVVVMIAAMAGGAYFLWLLSQQV